MLLYVCVDYILSEEGFWRNGWISYFNIRMSVHLGKGHSFFAVDSCSCNTAQEDNMSMSSFQSSQTVFRGIGPGLPLLNSQAEETTSVEAKNN